MGATKLQSIEKNQPASRQGKRVAASQPDHSMDLVRQLGNRNTQITQDPAENIAVEDNIIDGKQADNSSAGSADDSTAATASATPSRAASQSESQVNQTSANDILPKRKNQQQSDNTEEAPLIAQTENIKTDTLIPRKRHEKSVAEESEDSEELQPVPENHSRFARIGSISASAEKQADNIADKVLSGRVASPSRRPAGGYEPDTRAATKSVSNTLSQTGEPLPEGIQGSWGKLFGHDLSGIRVHKDNHSALDIGARAYSAGSHLVFGPGEYRPQSTGGRRILAHELAHSVSQNNTVIRRTPGAGVDRVEVDCRRNQITFYQSNRAFRYRLTSCSSGLVAQEYEAEVRQSRKQLYFIGGSFRFELDNDRQEGDPFDLFGEQANVNVLVWSGTASNDGDSNNNRDDDSEDGNGSGNDGEGQGRQGNGGNQGSGGQQNPRRGGLRISPVANDVQRALALRVLRELHGHREGSDDPVLDTYISMADIDALRRLDGHPQKDQIIRWLRAGGNQATEDSGFDYQRIIDIAIAQQDLSHFGNLFDFRFSSSEDGARPLVARPVHGRIVELSGDLVPDKEALFEFQVEDKVDLFAVPHVYIRWFAARQNSDGSLNARNIVEEERLNYIEINPDGFLNDKRFEVTFDQSGVYEVHAFVLHSFFLPNHFSTIVEVMTEEERLRNLQAQEEEQFGEVEETADHVFQDVATENNLARVGIVTASELTLPGLNLSTFTLLFADDPDTRGTRSTGTLDPSRLEPGAQLDYINEQISRVTRLRDRYIANNETELAQWAQERLDILNSLRTTLRTQLSPDHDTNYGVAVDGYYVSRKSGVRSGRLRLASWFTYNQSSQEYSATLIDYTELVRNENLTFTASGDDLNTVYERLFFLISSTYPNGRMRFSHQEYQGLSPSNQFVQFERPTDTLLNDIQEVVFSQPVSIVVNITAAVLTVFPPTAPAGIAIGLIYNGADTALNFMDAQRSGTVSSSNYVDLALLAVDIIPLAGKAVRLGETGLRVLRVGSEVAQLAGNVYVFNAQAFREIDLLRNGDVRELARLQTEINTLIAHNAPSAEIARKQQQMQRLQQRIRNRTEEVFLQMAATQGLQIVSQRGATHLATQAGIRHGILPEPGTTRAPRTEEEIAEAETRALIDEGDTDRARADLDQGALLQRDAADSTQVRRRTDPELSLGLPADLRAEVPVIRTEGEHGSVRVMAEQGLFGVKRVWVEAGRLATSADIADHVATVNLQRQYLGLTGSVRSALEYAGGILRGLPPDAVRRGRELRGEIEKLPPIIRRRAAELEAVRHALSDDEIALHTERIQDLEAQLAEHRRALANLNAQSQSVGYIAALDRVLDGTDRDISRNINPQLIRLTRARLTFARQIMSKMQSRVAGSVDPARADLPNDMRTELQTLLREIIYDPIFGRSALEELQLRTRTRPIDPNPRRRASDRVSMEEFTQRFLDHVRAVNALRQQRNASGTATRQAVRAFRQRPNVPPVGVGNVAAGTLHIDDGAGGLQQLGGIIMGGSQLVREVVPAPGQQPRQLIPINPRFRKRRASGVVETFDKSIDHAEQTVLGNAARALERRFPNTDPAQIQAELRMHVEGEPCFNCLAGIPGTREQAGRGPFVQFSSLFRGVLIIVTYDDPNNPNGPPLEIRIRDGLII